MRSFTIAFIVSPLVWMKVCGKSSSDMETFWAEEYAKHGLNISGYQDEEYGSENVAVAFAAARATTPANR